MSQDYDSGNPIERHSIQMWGKHPPRGGARMQDRREDSRALIDRHEVQGLLPAKGKQVDSVFAGFHCCRRREQGTLGYVKTATALPRNQEKPDLGKPGPSKRCVKLQRGLGLENDEGTRAKCNHCCDRKRRQVLGPMLG